MRYLLTILSLALTLVGCSRNDTTIVKTTKSTDLGTVDVTDQKQRIYDLGGGQICTMKPTVLTNGAIVIDMKVERSGEVLSKPRVQTTSGVAVAFSSGDVNFSLTPVIKQ